MAEITNAPALAALNATYGGAGTPSAVAPGAEQPISAAQAMAALNAAYGAAPSPAVAAQPDTGLSPQDDLDPGDHRRSCPDRHGPASNVPSVSRSIATGLNAAGTSAYNVLHHLANGADWVMQRSRAGPQMNNLPGPPSSRATRTKRQPPRRCKTDSNSMPQGGAAGAVGHLVGTGVATLPFAEGALVLSGGARGWPHPT